MYLKSLVLKGFKSFADRSALALEPGITAVVGPNGSGKSNISDAVLWVLGERNAKNLRGQAMEDVIFAGSSARKASGLAEVDLVLDNSDGTLPVDFDEVAITRRMYRNGESEYLINGTVARRMDVLDILHDSGLGTGTHSIISQGSLDSILQSKPEDRRALIEEAAGVLKHKQRKAKSERKLANMDQHLLRARDVVGEVARQLGPLERKAKKARTYQELAVQQAELALSLAVDDLRGLQKEWDAAKEREAALSAELEERRGAIEAAEKAVEELQERIRQETLDAGDLSRRHRAAAAAVEAGSEHPLAVAVVEKAGQEGLVLPKAEAFDSLAGRGVSAVIKGKRYLAGNMAFLQENGLLKQPELQKKVQEQADSLASEGKTPLLFACDEEMEGIIAVADTVRETSKAALRQFKEAGLKVVMLTGDNRITAEAIRKRLDIEEAISEVMPTQKESCIRELQEKGHKVAMVGDGINDAPALTRADVGIAIGAGTDIAIDSADVVLMKDSLADVVTAIDLSKSVIRNIRMNLFWAFFYNVCGIPVAAGLLYPMFNIRLSPMIGAAAMSLSSVCVVTNALRLRFFKGKTVPSDAAEEQKKNETADSGTAQLRTAERSAADDNREPDKEAIKEVKEERNGGKTPSGKGEKEMEKVIEVEGMMCAHCQMHVQKALAAVEGVSEAAVDLEAKKAVVKLSQEVSDETLMKAVEDAGYTAVSCSVQ